MLAIHNQATYQLYATLVANAFAKLSKCQQFTTRRAFTNFCKQLQTLLQSYQNVSNSQLLFYDDALWNGCKRFCKVIKMLAIHNQNSIKTIKLDVANAFAKLSKCQQFTTCLISCQIRKSLQTLLQSYQNVSNSQLIKQQSLQALRCKRFCKVIKMLAIHNYKGYVYHQKRVANAFAKLSKCQQFTTQLYHISNKYWLQTLLQSYQNVSNSQLKNLPSIILSSCKRFCKVIKMLAIHN